jgi:acyl-coenzyme A synthetase/AMP-(fatty) acid ligase/acyl carrier protein
LSAADSVAQTASHTFDISVWQFLAALMVGGRVHIFKDVIAHDPPQLLAAVARLGVTVLETVPSLLRLMLSEPAHLGGAPELPRLRWLIPTGEALPPDLCRRWLAAYPHVPLLNAYGPTECSDDVTHYAIHAAPPADLVHMPIGRPVRNTRLYVLSPELLPVPQGTAGELCVGGAGVGRGYLNDPARTAEVFIPDPFADRPGERLYRTMDLVRLAPGGALEFHGRIDHQVKVRGSRIELGEIESVLARHPEVDDTVVLVKESGADQRLAAFVVMKPAVPQEAARLRAFLAESLPDYMIPAAFVFLDAIPLTPNGKVDRAALAATDILEQSAPSEHTAPRNAVEQQLSNMWVDLLGVERVGVHDNFFDLGGHSLLTTQLVSRLRSAFQLEVPLPTFFEDPTVAGLAQVIELARWAEEVNLEEAVAAGDAYEEGEI